jgi:hypothetical protein
MQESVVGAAGKGTAPVAQLQNPANCRRYRARATADVQGFAGADHGHQPAVTSYTPERFRAKAGAVFQRCCQHSVRCQRILLNVKALAAVSRRHIACQIVLWQSDTVHAQSQWSQ